MMSRFRFCAVRSLVVLMAIPLVVHGGEASAVQSSAGALRVYGNTTTIELAPVLLAQKLHAAPVAISNGGVPNLFRPGEAELATNAETQALRVSAANPDLRIILTVSEGLYRIVARRSAGITKLEDLKGKRIFTVPVTSSGYFLHRMLRTVGLDMQDVTIRSLARGEALSAMVDALGKGEVDAVTIWEPEMENALRRIGDDAIEFPGNGVYRELFNLNTTAQQLADPVQRKRIVELVRSILKATQALHRDPREAWELVAKSGGLYEPELIARTWHHHRYPGQIVPDLLDVLEDEEKYVAREGNGRTPRTRAELARLIDDSVLKEVLASDPSLRVSPPTPEAVRAQVLKLRAARLTEGTRQAVALREVKRVQHALNHYREIGRWQDAAALFTRQAVANFSGREEVVGREAVLQHLRRSEGHGGPVLPHGALNTRLVLSPVVTFDADGRTARGRWHEVAMTGRYGVSADWGGGIYENEYVQEDGAWRIARLTYHPAFAGSYAQGWRNVDQSDKVTIVPFHYDPARAGRPVVPVEGAMPAPGRLNAGELLRDVAAQRAQLARLADEAAVLNLQHAYGFYFDRRMWDDVADLFAADGSFQYGNRGAWVGPASIRRALEQIGPQGLAPGVLNDHAQLQFVVTVAPDGLSARARGTELVMAGQHGADSWWGVNVVENSYVKQDGKWRIAAAQVAQRMRTDYAAGWQSSALPDVAARTLLAADRPLPAMYRSYPELDVPPVHFTAPARGEHLARRAQGAAGRDAHALESALFHAERELTVEIARDASENVANAYGYYIDEFLWDASADLFAVNGSKELSYIGNYIGRERVRESMVARYGRNGRRAVSMAIHQKTQPVVNVAPDGGSARVRSRLLQFNSQQKQPGSWVAGIYENNTVREDGVWKLSRMDLDYTWTAGYVGGWARVAPEANRQFAPATAQLKVPPDGPLRGVTYAPYPDVATMAFHYANPVSGRAPPELLPP